MRLSRTDPVPVLTIVAGGVIGAALSFGFLALSPSGEVPATLDLLHESSATLESSTRVPAPIGTVTGQVTDASSGSPVATAQVYITSLGLGGLSQQNGSYLLQDVPAGTYTLHVARMGYRTTEAQVTVGGGQTVEQNFSVREEAIQLDEIFVTGTRCGTQRRISAPPGWVQEQGSSITIRGFSAIEPANQPLIYIDGVRVYNSDGCNPRLDDIDPNDIESIEIVRGPAAAAQFGEEASAGAIVITLKEEARRRR